MNNTLPYQNGYDMISCAYSDVTKTTKSTVTLRLDSLKLKEKYNLSEQNKNYLPIEPLTQGAEEINWSKRVNPWSLFII